MALNNLDREIIVEIQKNGRIASKEIAKNLNVSDGTVRFRLKRLMGQNILRITGSVNPLKLEDGIIAIIGMELEKRIHKMAMERISELKGVISVCNVTGTI